MRISTLALLKALLLVFVILPHLSFSQYCDSITPAMNVDLSASPNISWTSPMIARDGNCCGTVAPDNCLEFIITLHPNSIGVSFSIAAGAVPPGALFYQIDCGPPTPVGSVICLDGPGPHHLTFCKPGNNDNAFSIVSYSEPIIGSDITLNAGCQGFIYAEYYNEPSISWTSIGPGNQGDYDSYLSCTAGCDTTYVTAPPLGAPAFVDYLVCGDDVGECNPNPICDTIRVNFVDPIQVDVTPALTEICAGDPPVLLTANVTGGTGPFTYLWSNGATTATISETGGTHTVTVTDQGGCLTATDSAVIIEHPLPIVDAGPDQTVCDGVAVTLNGSGALSYTWNNGVNDGVSFVQAVGTNTYTVTGTDVNGCVNTDQVNVTVNPLPVVDAGANQVVCEGAAVTLNGSGAVNYTWDNGVTDGVSFVQAVGTTTYTVTGTDANGCVNTDQVDVTVNPLPVVDAGSNQTVCEGTTVMLNGSGAASYTWDNGVTNGVGFVPPVGTTTYTVTGTDAHGCVNTDQVDVLVNPLPVIDAGTDQVVCEGTSVTLNGAGGVSYAWDNGVNNGVSFVPPVGTVTYTVTGTDANGCTNTDQVEVLVNPLPVVDAGPNQEVCDGATVTLNGSGAVSYVWGNGVVDGVSFTPPLGTTAYSVVGTDVNGCSNLDQVEVLVNPLPVVGAGADQVVCEGTPIALNGSGALTYVWDNGVTNGTSFVPPVGTTTYTVTGTDVNGCVNTDQVEVLVNPLPIVDAGPDQAVCEGTAVTLSGSGALTYDWNNGVIDGVSFVQELGTVTYSVIGVDGNGCGNGDQVNVTVNPLPLVDAGVDKIVCEGTSIVFAVTGTSNLQWSNGITNGVPFTQPVGTMNYTVSDSLPTGCSASDDVTVTVNPLPVVLAYDIVICPGDGVTLEGQGAENYEWTGGIIDGVEFFPTQTSLYEVTGTNSFGCTSTALAQVTVLPGATADFDILDLTLSTLSPGTGFTNNSSGAVSYEWTFGDGSGISNEFEPYHEFPTDEAGSYEVTLLVTSPDGCTSERVKYVYVTLDYSVYVPNAFTPDNNGVNEVFKPVLDGFDETDYALYIYNRWGELIFESHDMNVGWDGTYSQYDKKVQDGVFTWKIEARIKNSSDTKIFVGHASILK